MVKICKIYMCVVTGEKKKRGRPRKQKVVIESDEDEPLQTYTSLESAAAETPSTAAAADSESQQPDEYNSAAGETTPYSSQPPMQVRICQVVISGLLLYFKQKLLLLM